MYLAVERCNLTLFLDKYWDLVLKSCNVRSTNYAGISLEDANFGLLQAVIATSKICFVTVKTFFVCLFSHVFDDANIVFSLVFYIAIL